MPVTLTSNTEHWAAAKYPGDTVKIVRMTRGDEEGEIRIQDYCDSMRAGIGRYKVGSFLPGITECSPGDTPKVWPEHHRHCETKQEADRVMWAYIRQALQQGWL